MVRPFPRGQSGITPTTPQLVRFISLAVFAKDINFYHLQRSDAGTPGNKPTVQENRDHIQRPVKQQQDLKLQFPKTKPVIDADQFC